MIRIGLIALWSTTAAAQGYIRTVASDTEAGTICVTWSQRQITYRIDSLGSARTPGDAEFDAIQKAWASWQFVSNGCSDFQFTRGGDIVGGTVGKGTTADNVFIFREQRCDEIVDANDPCLSAGTCANQYRCWNHSDATLGLTTVTYSPRSGIVSDADVEFNAASFLFTTVDSPPCEQEASDCVAYDVQNVATHEIGHVLGFSHVPDGNSLMAATAPIGELSKRTIDYGTAQGFCLAYPSGRPPTSCDPRSSSRVLGENVGSFGVNCASSSVGSVPLMLAVALLARRRKRST